MTSFCSSCKTHKYWYRFPILKNGKCDSWCKKCHSRSSKKYSEKVRIRQIKYRKENPEKIKTWRKNNAEHVLLYSKNKRLKNKKQAIEYKGGKCIKCGYNKSRKALTFHHRNEKDKILSISEMVAKNKTWDEIKKELDKCDLLCFNCHMEEHDNGYE